MKKENALIYAYARDKNARTRENIAKKNKIESTNTTQSTLAHYRSQGANGKTY